MSKDGKPEHPVGAHTSSRQQKSSDTIRGIGGIDRRSMLKITAATTTALATGSVFAPSVRAAKTIKLGYVSPQTGPLAPFAEADNFIIANFKETVKNGIKIGNTTYPVEVIVKDSQSNPIAAPRSPRISSSATRSI